MHVAVTRPDPELLTVEPEDDPTETPERCETHVGHDWWHKTLLDDPRRDEL